MVSEPSRHVLSNCVLTYVQNKLGANMKTLESAEQIYAKRQAKEASP